MLSEVLLGAFLRTEWLEFIGNLTKVKDVGTWHTYCTNWLICYLDSSHLMPLKCNTYSCQKTRILSGSMVRRFAVFTILFLFTSQILQPDESEASDLAASQIIVCDEFYTQCPGSDVASKTHLEECEHCTVFLLANPQYAEQLPAYHSVQKLAMFMQAKFFLQPTAIPKHLRRHRLNNRGPPVSGTLVSLLSKTIFPAQNAIVVTSAKFKGGLWW